MRVAMRNSPPHPQVCKVGHRKSERWVFRRIGLQSSVASGHVATMRTVVRSYTGSCGMPLVTVTRPYKVNDRESERWVSCRLGLWCSAASGHVATMRTVVRSYTGMPLVTVAFAAGLAAGKAAVGISPLRLGCQG
jgi:hypothetical protein